ncbi:hypothetical protein AQUCO_04200031v1 [Aquilegia coerulea]|uniref:Uncharacterized protein n=1 Tax=Aquilegia coerulea TaxID=218851 RepID=A0A2G5CP02_AQUCA|nr:hypothetical protein AQUCO_04200031v1 [Aquilegia coerulea]
MKSMFFELTLNNMMRMIAGKKYYGEDAEELKEAKFFKDLVKETISISGASDISDFLPVLKQIGVNGFEKKVLSLKQKRDKYLQELIEEKRKFRSAVKMEKRDERTLLDVLLSLQDTEPEYYTDEMICGMAWVLYASGTETSACTMEWAMSLLLNNPRVLRKAQPEIDNYMEQQDRFLHESDVNNLPYLQAIISETLRMYPPGPLLPHESSEECIVGGYAWDNVIS